jgi:hypothetical protein
VLRTFIFFGFFIGSEARALATESQTELFSKFPAAWSHISESAALDTFDQIIILADIHGSLTRLTQLFKANALITQQSGDFQYTWNASLKKTGLIVVGDYLNKGPDSIQVLYSTT